MMRRRRILSNCHQLDLTIHYTGSLSYEYESENGDDICREHLPSRPCRPSAAASSSSRLPTQIAQSSLAAPSMSSLRSTHPKDVMSRNPRLTHPTPNTTITNTKSTKSTSSPPHNNRPRSSTPTILSSLQASYSSQKSRNSMSSPSPSSSPQPFNVAILIISDTASRDASTDKVIPTLIQTFADYPGKTWSIRKSKIVPDDLDEIQRVVSKWAEVEERVDLIVTSGGTGFSQRDVTPEVSRGFSDFWRLGEVWS